jgi:hypothetical protein
LAKSRVDITQCQHGKFLSLYFFVLYYTIARGNRENSKLCENTPPSGVAYSTQFLVFPFPTRVDITVYQHGKCFIFVKYRIIFKYIVLFMAFQNSLFCLVDKRSVKTHIRTVVRIWTGVPDVIYLAGNFCFANRKNVFFLNFRLRFTDKNFKQPNCF